MTNLSPKDKAIQLVETFDRALTAHNSIVAAEICCNEIIESYDQTIDDAGVYDGMHDIRLSAKDSIKYWRQVKTEIEKH